MTTDSRSRRRNKDDSPDTSKKTPAKPTPPVPADSSLRRSNRDTPPKTRNGAANSGPSTTRKSERLEKRTPPSASSGKKRKIEGISKSSPLRRSDRGKKRDFEERRNGTTPLDTKRVVEKEKTVKQLNMETRNVGSSKKGGSGGEAASAPKNLMNARSYKALFLSQRRKVNREDNAEQTEKLSKSLQVDSSEGREGGSDPVNCDKDRIDEGVGERPINKDDKEAPEKSGSNSDGDDEEVSKSDAEAEFSCSKSGHKSPDELPNLPGEDISVVRETIGDAERVPEGCSDNFPQFPFYAEGEKYSSFESCTSCSRPRRIGLGSSERELCSCNVGKVDLKDRMDHQAIANADPERREHYELKETPSDVLVDGHENVCTSCKKGGKLLSCDGKDCNRCYHPSCLDPPLDIDPPGIWHCTCCVKKKIEMGVHSVARGIESVLDAREVVTSDAEETIMRKQKQYLVKYQGLSHIHNHWVPENQLLIEAPSLVSEFGRIQGPRWNREWTVPHRLLMKRPLTSFTKQDGYCVASDGDNSGCHYEWLVKWRTLDYSHATWELESPDFLCTLEGQNLVGDYKIRCQTARELAEKGRKGAFVKLGKLPEGSLPTTDNRLLNIVNKLRECWFKGQNAAGFGSQDRMMTVIGFIMSVVDDFRPFLIVADTNALTLWEAEVFRFAPSVDVVVYSGSSDTRQSIRSLEFHGGLQVLVSSPEAVVEDLQILSGMKWVAIIVDECQLSGISSHLKKIGELAAEMKLLLFSDQIKDAKAEYLNLLSFLDPSGDMDKFGGCRTDSNDILNKLKDRLSKFTAFGGKPESSKFEEYWTPAQISNLQLEQYCDTLLSNSMALCSISRSDPVGALHEILSTVRKCCDHPYLVDASLQRKMIEEGVPHVELVEVGIKASGKLQLLDKMLSEIKHRRQRVLVIYQAIIGSQMSIGNVLEDLLHQRYTQNSYERIDSCISASKKRDALNRFNEQNSEQFVFLLENRACSAGIKLSSVDVIVIFNSDWNPANDMKSLQRISICSQFQTIKVFRLYSLFTVEEKALILAKQGVNLDNNLQSFSRSTIDNLLTWGAQDLFCLLDDYHAEGKLASAANIPAREPLLSNVMKELPGVLGGSHEKDIISKVNYVSGTYNGDVSLLGEKNTGTTAEEPHFLWKKLLNRNNPRWKCLSGSTASSTVRTKKRVQYFDGSMMSDEPCDVVDKKRRKVGNNSVDPTSGQPDRKGGPVTGLPSLPTTNQSIGTKVDNTNASHPPNYLSDSSTLLQEDKLLVTKERKLSEEQKGLLGLLKEEIEKLGEVLKLQRNTKEMVGVFLEYVMGNRQVQTESLSILQAFQISLCWIASSVLKQKIDKRDSLLLAKQLLRYECTEEETTSLYYSKLRPLKKSFLQYLKKLNNNGCLKDLKAVTQVLSGNRVVPASAVNLEKLNSGLEDKSDEQVAKRGAPLYQKRDNVDEGGIDQILPKDGDRQGSLPIQNQEETEDFFRSWDEKKRKLEDQHRIDLALTVTLQYSEAFRNQKLKMLENEFRKKKEELEREKDLHIKSLEARQLKDGCNSDKVMLEKQVDVGPSNMLASTSDNTLCSNVLSEAEISVTKDSGNMVQPASLIGTSVEQPNEACQSSDAAPEFSADFRTCEEECPDEIPLRKQITENRLEVTDTDHDTEIIIGSLEDNLRTNAGETTEPVLATFQPSAPCEVALGDVAQSHSVDTSRTLLTVEEHPDSVASVNKGPSKAHHKERDGETCPLVDKSADRQCIKGNEGEVEPLCPNEAGSGTLATGQENSASASQASEGACQNLGAEDNHVLTCKTPAFLVDKSAEMQLETIMGDEGNSHVEVVQTSSINTQVEPPTLTAEDEHPSSAAPAGEDACRTNYENFMLTCEASSLFVPEKANINKRSQPVESPELRVDSTDGVADLQPAARVGSGHTDVLAASCQSLPLVSANVAPRSHQRGMPSGANVAFAQVPVHQFGSSIPGVPLSVDPLQNELDRIRKETDQAVKNHEDMKLQLRSQCAKEIEEMALQIRKKYDAKIQETESEFQLKKGQLINYGNKVLMNKLLADAFRSKCVDIRPPGVPQAVPSSFMEHLQQLAVQPALGSAVAGLSSVGRSAPTLQTTANIGSTSAGQFAAVQPTTRASAYLPLSSQHSPGQQTGPVICRSLAVSSSIPSRPLHIGAITPSLSNLRASGELRAPAPHLQPFRASAAPSVSSPSSLLHMQNHQVSTTTSTPQIPQIPPIESSQLTSQSLQQQVTSPLPPSQHSMLVKPVHINSIFDSRSSEPESSGLEAPNNPHLSQPQLRGEVENQPPASQPSVLPPLPEISPDFDALDLSDFAIPSNVQVSLTPPAAVTDVVCLSDDD